MSVHYGYAGKVLKIDLCNRKLSEYPWSAQDRENNLGGKIMAAQILQDHLTGKETAFSDDNWVVITTGPLTGTGAPGSVRFDIATRSPKDDLPAFSNCGGNLGVYLKKAGSEAIDSGYRNGNGLGEVSSGWISFFRAGTANSQENQIKNRLCH